MLVSNPVHARRCARSSAFFALLIGICWASTTRAAEAPDVVRTKDGGYTTGVILEKDPKGEVVIRTPSGEQRSFSMSDVEYAGPADAAPTAPKPDRLLRDTPTGTAEGKAERTVKVHLTGSRPGLVFYDYLVTVELTDTRKKLSADAFRELCVAPCDAQLTIGKHRIGVNQSVDDDLQLEQSLEVTGPTTVHATYESHAGERGAGWLVALLSLGSGVALAAEGYTGFRDGELLGSAAFYGGSGLAVAGLAIGGFKILRTDSLSLRAHEDSAWLKPQARARPLDLRPGLNFSLNF